MNAVVRGRERIVSGKDRLGIAAGEMDCATISAGLFAVGVQRGHGKGVRDVASVRTRIARYAQHTGGGGSADSDSGTLALDGRAGEVRGGNVWVPAVFKVTVKVLVPLSPGWNV